MLKIKPCNTHPFLYLFYTHPYKYNYNYYNDNKHESIKNYIGVTEKDPNNQEELLVSLT
jgi:hypothetical protein